jgi:type II secretory pathway component PulF
MSAALYTFRAMDRSGKERRGQTRALSREDAFRQVTSMGLTPVSIRATHVKSASRARRIRTKDIAQFTYQLGVLIQARIPIGDGLMTIGEQESNAKFRAILIDIAAKVQSGTQIAGALADHVGVFGPVYVETVRAAEQSGNMSKVLEHLSGMLERNAETGRQVKSALMYPICIIATLSLAVAFLLTFVVPKFARMYQQRGIELPVFTRMLAAFGEFVQGYWWACLIGAAIGGWMLRRTWKSERGRAAIDRVLHGVPVLEQILRGLALSRFARVFSVTLGSGLGLIRALEMSGRASGRPLLQQDVNRMVEQVRAGGRLADVLATCDYIPTFSKRMITAGEQAGELGRMCDIVAAQHERETTYLTKNLGTIIEPVLIVLIAGVVLVVALAIFLPMWNMVKLIG